MLFQLFWVLAKYFRNELTMLKPTSIRLWSSSFALDGRWIKLDHMDVVDASLIM